MRQTLDLDAPILPGESAGGFRLGQTIAGVLKPQIA
jgi:hypothetical protein